MDAEFKKFGIIDSHAHLDDTAYDEDRDALIENLKVDGVEFVINPASDLESSKKALKLSQNHENIFACIGNHPEFCKEYSDQVEDEYRKMAEDKNVVAIGEIGLDYYYGADEKEDQKIAFIKQIELARDLNLPIVIHSRDALVDTMEILKSHAQGMRVMLHAFSESKEVMNQYIKLGFYISMGGIVTFKNAKKSVLAMTEVPLDRLLLETDSPYLTPVPYRGKRNHPKYTYYVAEKIAQLKGVEVEEVIEKTRKNSMDFFDLKSRIA